MRMQLRAYLGVYAPPRVTSHADDGRVRFFEKWNAKNTGNTTRNFVQKQAQSCALIPGWSTTHSL
jgi:hypothetical protein